MALEIRKIGLLACGYRIRWLGSSIRWRSRIIDYVHRERFTDVQAFVPRIIPGYINIASLLPRKAPLWRTS